MRPFFLALLLSLPGHTQAEPRYEVVPDWPQLPAGEVLGLCAGVGVDSQQRVYLFHRRERAWSNPFPTDPIRETTVTVFDGETGAILTSWGAGEFMMPHGLSIDHEDQVWLTDVALHQVFKYSPSGQRLMALGEAGVAGTDPAHFNQPADVAVAKDGSFYVADGYKNTRVIQFSASGEFLREWGEAGSAPGQFRLVHGLALDSLGRVYVCDRTNSRVQVFDGQGVFLDQWHGPQIGRPYGITVDAQDQVFLVDGGEPSLRVADRGKAVQLNARGQVLATFGSYGSAPGQFQMAHDVAVGADGAVYVAEGAGKRLQKFVLREVP
jgi:peptidylamidoglycolate lyase